MPDRHIQVQPIMKSPRRSKKPVNSPEGTRNRCDGACIHDANDVGWAGTVETVEVLVPTDFKDEETSPKDTQIQQDVAVLDTINVSWAETTGAFEHTNSDEDEHEHWDSDKY